MAPPPKKQRGGRQQRNPEFVNSQTTRIADETPSLGHCFLCCWIALAKAELDADYNLREIDVHKCVGTPSKGTCPRVHLAIPSSVRAETEQMVEAKQLAVRLHDDETYLLRFFRADEAEKKAAKAKRTPIMKQYKKRTKCCIRV
jgi:hypothetical protein